MQGTDQQLAGWLARSVPGSVTTGQRRRVLKGHPGWSELKDINSHHSVKVRQEETAHESQLMHLTLTHWVRTRTLPGETDTLRACQASTAHAAIILALNSA